LEDSSCNLLIHSSMALQPFVWPWPLFQIHNLFNIHGRTPRMSDKPVARPLPTHIKQKHRINAQTNIHALSGIRTNDPSIRENENNSRLRPRGHCDRRSCKLINVISRHFLGGLRKTMNIGASALDSHRAPPEQAPGALLLCKLARH
jgi:hypothetical protein